MSLSFNVADKVVYPSHGVGELIAIESQSIGGVEVPVYVISFTHDKMLLKIPINRAIESGLRPITNRTNLSKIYEVLQSKPQYTNKIWNKKFQEYEAKLNSGNVILVAEVIRDLYKESNCEVSYTERLIYESALKRLASEISLLESLTLKEAMSKVIAVLKQKLVA